MVRARASSRAAGCAGVPSRKGPRSSFPAQAFGVAAISILVAASATAALAGCNKRDDASPAEKAPKLGEPLGVRVDDVKDLQGKTLGSLQGAFAVTQGQAAEPLVPGMARVLHRIGQRCPALFAKDAEPIHVRGRMSGGALAFPPAAAGEAPELRCMRDAMHGEKISDLPLEADIAIELRPENPK